MLASVLRLSGLDQRLAAFKLRLDEKAYEAVDHVKAVVVRMFVVAALAVAAAGFALLALIIGLVALYGWLERGISSAQCRWRCSVCNRIGLN